jgi:hypothetical protein
MTRRRKTRAHPLRSFDAPHRARHADGSAPAATGPEASTEALHALSAENLTLARELARVQCRCTQWRDAAMERERRLEAQLLQARAACIVKDTRIAALRDTLDALQRRAATWLTNEELLRRLGDLRACNRALERQLQALRHVAAPAEPANPVPPATASGARCVLFVGGRARQLPACRALVEARGERFEHAGGSPAEVEDLHGLLAQAGLVVVQAGYVCRDALEAIRAHCTRTATRCVLLAKPCTQAFEGSLDAMSA